MQCYNVSMDLKDKRLKLTAKRIETLERLNLFTVEDLLFYYPYRYEILNNKPISEWKIKEKVSFEGTVVSAVKTFRKGRFTSSYFEVLSDDQILKITIFNRPWASSLRYDQKITIQGVYNGNQKVTAITYDTKSLQEHTEVTPVYSLKNGMQQRTIRDCIRKVYDEVENELQDDIPEEFIRKYRLLRKRDALEKIHFPRSENDIRLARRTLKYEEFLSFFTGMQLLRNEDGNGVFKAPKNFDMHKIQKVIDALPFVLTEGQEDALADIFQELSSARLMYRLVQGDVGCGKTVVAILALYASVLAGYQGALLAPTEILARQHLKSTQDILAKTGICIEVLYSGLSTKEKKQILEDTENGKVDILIGTHAILVDDVKFKNLGFVVADEQQRFGVSQRKALRAKGDQVDFLLMSATPIPRTLASAIFGDMNISAIETLPAGRKEPVTQLIEENSFRSVLDDVKRLLEEGRQLYVICAAVEENAEFNVRDVTKMAATLRDVFAPYQVASLHGRMSSDEKQSIMNDFYTNKYQILVSTTVVEVGMNVVNATGMIIYDADRFGLSQLHQLRGRIQRGSDQGHCWLLTDRKDPDVKERLNVLVNSNNGFEIANEDLRLRGPGDLLGTRQSGLPDFILGNIQDDAKMMEVARIDADTIVKHPDNPDYMGILEKMMKRNQQKNSLID